MSRTLLRFCCLLALALTPLVPAGAQAFPQTFQNAALSGDGGFPQIKGHSGRVTYDPNAATWKTLPADILRDQRKIYWDFPRELAHGRHWRPVAAFVGTIGVLAALDQFQSPYFRRTTTYQRFNTGFSGTNTSLLIVAVPVATYFTGWFRKDAYARSTALLMGEAVADSEISAKLLKLTTRRARPETIQPKGNFADSWTDSPTIVSGGFPSGHTIAAFSVATVLSRRYGQNHGWVPYLAYGIACAIGFSRVSLSAHNVSDVVAGAALGYAISRFVVLGRHKR